MSTTNSELMVVHSTGQASKEGSPLPYSFLEIIDADHSAINRLAGKVRKALLSGTDDCSVSKIFILLLEVTWRLIRHDFSEDVVMRPAFSQVLGRSGVEMAEQDRTDHFHGRSKLLDILKDLALVREDHPDVRERSLARVKSMVAMIFDELAEHMKVESGDFLPYFESVIPTDVSARLGREYADTLLLTPSLIRYSGETEGQPGEAVFEGGVEQYIHSTPTELKQHYSNILEIAKTPAGRVWFETMTNAELEKLPIEKKPSKPRSDTVNQDCPAKKPVRAKVLTNALGLPVSWDHLGKGKL